MKKLEIEYRVLGMISTNTYFLINKETREALVVDPADSAEYIMKQFELRGYKLCAILLTHGHFDHIYAADRLRELSGAKIYAFEAERALLADPYMNRSVAWADAMTLIPDEFFADNQKVTLAGLDFTVLHTPGHTAGSCCFYFEDEEVLISGDTLFRETFGRTDLSTGSQAAMYTSLKRLFALPPATAVYPGHEEFTTIEHELRFNPAARSLRD